jgi:hypothetical protein
VLNNHVLHGYHCTRLTDDEIAHIESNGMQLPDGAMLKRRVEALERAGRIEAQVGRAFVAENSADDTNRAGQLCFCFFPPHLAGECGIESLLRYWGGEALYRWHDCHPERGRILGTIGVPCLVEADVPIASLNELSFLEENAVDQFLHTRGHATKGRHQDRARRDISATNIRRVIRYPEADFIALTRCDAWRKPLG